MSRQSVNTSSGISNNTLLLSPLNNGKIPVHTLSFLNRTVERNILAQSETIINIENQPVVISECDPFASVPDV